MGSVYKAERVPVGKLVAIKFLHASFANDREFQARFERETRVMSKLDAPELRVGGRLRRVAKTRRTSSWTSSRHDAARADRRRGPMPPPRALDDRAPGRSRASPTRTSRASSTATSSPRTS